MALFSSTYLRFVLGFYLITVCHGVRNHEISTDIDGVEEFSEPEEPKVGNNVHKDNNSGGSVNIMELTKTMNLTLALVNLTLERIKEESAAINQRLERLEQKSGVSRSDELVAMLNNPVAQLFSEKNFTGKTEHYRFENSTYEGGCRDLRKIQGKVESVKTFGKCVRVFRGSKCMGWSLAIYPGNQHESNILNSKLTRVKSIGPCLPDEFKNAHMQGNNVIKTTADIRKYVPDLLEFFSWERLRTAVEVSNPDISVTHYKLGVKNRLEFIRARVMPEHLNISQPNVDLQNSEFFKSLEREDKDVAGYAVPPSIGGPSNENYNVFPQSESAGKELASLASKVQMFLRNKFDSTVGFTLIFVYESEMKTRPYAFNYWISYARKKIDYSFIAN